MAAASFSWHIVYLRAGRLLLFRGRRHYNPGLLNDLTEALWACGRQGPPHSRYHPLDSLSLSCMGREVLFHLFTFHKLTFQSRFPVLCSLQYSFLAQNRWISVPYWRDLQSLQSLIYSFIIYETLYASMTAQTVKNLPAMQETRDWSLGQEDSLEKGMATHSSILAWRSPWIEEPGRLQSMGSQIIGYDWATKTWCSLKGVSQRK